MKLRDINCIWAGRTYHKWIIKSYDKALVLSFEDGYWYAYIQLQKNSKYQLRIWNHDKLRTICIKKEFNCTYKAIKHLYEYMLEDEQIKNIEINDKSFINQEILEEFIKLCKESPWEY